MTGSFICKPDKSGEFFVGTDRIVGYPHDSTAPFVLIQ